MADLLVDGANLVVRLSPLERLGAFRGDVRIPLATITTVRVSDSPWSELRGIRSPGTGLPGVISLCTRRGFGIRDFAAVYGRRKAVVVEASGAGFDRLVISRRDPEQAARAIEEAVAAAGRGGDGARPSRQHP